MRYFTRIWYDFAQELAKVPDLPPSLHERIENLWWKLPETSYLAYREAIKSRLDDDARKLVESSPWQWHDGRIVSVESQHDCVVVRLEDQLAKTRYRRQVRISFSGVTEANGMEGIEGQHILYDELMLHLDNCYEYSVLLDKSEFSIRFRSVTVDTEDTKTS